MRAMLRRLRRAAQSGLIVAPGAPKDGMTPLSFFYINGTAATVASIVAIAVF
jgi:hypothetical protein